MASIFICYPRKKQDQTMPIITALKAEGWDVFYDEETPGGVVWNDHLTQELKKTECMIVILDHQVTYWMNQEILKFISIEQERGVKHPRILPLQIEEACDRPLGAQGQSINFIDWDGRPDSKPWKKLTDSLYRWGIKSQPKPNSNSPTKARLVAEAAQAENDHTLREQRLIEEISIERQKLVAVAEDLARKRLLEEAQAKYEMEKQRRNDSIALMQAEIARIEQDKAALTAEMQAYEQRLDAEHAALKQFEDEIAKAQNEPKQRQAALAELDRRLKNARKTLNDYVEEGADEDSIARAGATVKKLTEERKKLQQQQAEAADKVSEPTRKRADSENNIADLNTKITNLRHRLHTVDSELETWREKRRALV